MSRDAPEIFAGKLFDIEHALNLYALSYVQLPAAGLYDAEGLESVRETAERCHIYFVGYAPRIDLTDVRQNGDRLIQAFTYLGQTHELSWPMPPHATLEEEGEHKFVLSSDGARMFPSMSSAMYRLHTECHPVGFDVQYVGQAYGAGGERSAVDRLLKHETLQKISLLGAPENFRLELLLVEIEPNNKLITFINPWAEKQDDSGDRITAGLDKLFGTSHAEMIALYEAAMIRYFQPRFNKEFKNSFPSTNLKILQDCYDKDMAALVAEFCFDELPYTLFSNVQPASHYHIAKFNLHSKHDRDMFFGLKDAGAVAS
ncbi:MAG TPA: hypothetical protein VEZ48_01550 [Sphingomonadaceae bacterium]|jgi:hypothetical protein|nr:hypothetical protein [Sphingomonadaceae bacterium]